MFISKYTNLVEPSFAISANKFAAIQRDGRFVETPKGLRKDFSLCFET